MASTYRGRLAPSPNGYLHLGHARTFHIAWQRARGRKSGILIYRDEDLDPRRSKPEFSSAGMEDLRWLGLDWDEGPDVGGPHSPYEQSKRRDLHLQAWKQLAEDGLIYPSNVTRKEIRRAKPLAGAEGENVFPAVLRPPDKSWSVPIEPGEVPWRFRVPDGERVTFEDGRSGIHSYVAGVDFGDFLVWSRDGAPTYELAVVVDDLAMGITEIVRGEDLLVSTARQLLIYRAFGALDRWPAFYHVPLVRDLTGQELSKRYGSLGLRHLREQGVRPEEILPALEDDSALRQLLSRAA